MKVYAKHFVVPRGAGSQARLTLTFEGLLGGWFARMTADINQRYLEMEAAGLKRRSEQGPNS
jgi:hypothetical protein